MKDQIKPGNFGKTVPADSKRQIFDFYNEQILYSSKPVDYVFIGDSITEYWDLTLYFGHLGYIVNRGIGGDCTNYILARSDADVFQLEPKNLVYMAGTNDLLTVVPDIWWRKLGANRNTVIESISENIESFMKKCCGINGYFCSVIPSDLCVPYCNYGISDMTLEVNDRIKSLCEKHKMTYIDYHSALCSNDGKTIKDGLTYDGVHPNHIGYGIMSEIFLDVVKASAN